jgi:hypothetical protein
MAITPTGSPVWVRATDFSHYGGDPNKQNYQSQGAVDPLTDVTAEQLSRLAADVAAIARVSPFCVLTFQADDALGNDPTVEYCNLMTGVRATSYVGGSPPAGFPSVVFVAGGEHLITFDASYTDPYGVVGSFAPRHAAPSGSTTPAFDTAAVVAGQTVTVYASSGGVAATDKRVTVEVW